MAKRRSLILAGGGVKVAFQAGVLQVWLDEAALEFDHVDAASGGVFNLAMLCQGSTGTQIADNWRRLPALDVIQLNWRSFLRPFAGESISKLDRFRSKVLAGSWGLDFGAIRSSPLEATFNSYNFSRQHLAVLEPHEMTEDLLVSCVSLPMWFPPVRIGGETFIDSVYITDANVEEAIRRGADELWVIWTVSERSEWHGGLVGSYFGVIEAAANGHFRRIVRRIEDSNAAIRRGEPGEFGRPIELKILRAEVPLHYLLNLNSDRFASAVERGVQEARRWCEAQDIPYEPLARPAAEGGDGLRFSEVSKGSALSMRLSVEIDDIGAFVTDPRHEARLQGEVEAPGLGGRLDVERGVLNVLVDDGQPARREARYRLELRAPDGRAFTLVATKHIDGGSGRGAWHENTTLHARIFDGGPDASSGHAEDPVATAVMRTRPLDVARQLTSLRGTGASARARRAALRRFGLFYLGGLWDVYGRRVLPVSPV